MTEWTISSQVMGGIIMVGIYAIKNKINNKIYIGRSTDIQRRWTTHLRDALKKLKPELFQS